MPYKLLLITILSVYCTVADAQIHDSLNYKGKSEFAISVGILSFDQWRGISHREAANYGSLVDMPHTYTSAAFLTYRYYISNRIALGCALGLDNQRGRLSYGGPHTPYQMEYGSSGSYSREFYTAAIEALYFYERSEDISVYFFAGAGVTTGHVNYSIYPDAKYNFYKLYTPVSRNYTHFNAQVTPIGVKAGRRLCTFAEFGFGYKGMVCAGISYRT